MKTLSKSLILVAMFIILATSTSPKADAQMPTSGCYWDTQYVVFGYVGPGTYIGRACYSNGIKISFTPWFNID